MCYEKKHILGRFWDYNETCHLERKTSFINKKFIYKKKSGTATNLKLSLERFRSIISIIFNKEILWHVKYELLSKHWLQRKQEHNG